MDDKKAQCPVGFLWRRGVLGKFLSVFLGLALIGILLKSVFWTFFMAIFAVKWVLLIAIGFFVYIKVSKIWKKK
jgi:hypothetical protein